MVKSYELKKSSKEGAKMAFSGRVEFFKQK